jgi:hypothetical protein
VGGVGFFGYGWHWVLSQLVFLIDLKGFSLNQSEKPIH